MGGERNQPPTEYELPCCSFHGKPIKAFLNLHIAYGMERVKILWRALGNTSAWGHQALKAGQRAA